MYRIPKEEEVRQAIFKAFRRHNSFSSLNKLREAIIEELKKMNEEYTISMRRARILTARAGFVKVEVKKKHGRKKFDRCPVCDGKLREIRNLSLLGKETVIGYKCELCKYKSKINEVPIRYTFYLTK